jgi:hypothetical protein
MHPYVSEPKTPFLTLRFLNPIALGTGSHHHAEPPVYCSLKGQAGPITGDNQSGAR